MSKYFNFSKYLSDNAMFSIFKRKNEIKAKDNTIFSFKSEAENQFERLKIEVQEDHKCPFPEELLTNENKTLIQNL